MTEDIIDMQINEDVVDMQLSEQVISMNITEKTVVAVCDAYGFTAEDTYGFEGGSYGFICEEIRK